MAWKDGQVSPEVADDLLLSSNYVAKSVMIATAARDSGSSPTTTLRKGLMLAKITASGKYAEFISTETDGTEDEEGAVILAYDVDVSDGDVEATVYFQGMFRKNKVLLNGETFVWNDCQRLIIRDI